MKCPYQTMIIHIPEYPSGYAQDVTQFCECIKSECPFYHTITAYKKTIERCRRAESEINNGKNDI